MDPCLGWALGPTDGYVRPKTGGQKRTLRRHQINLMVPVTWTYIFRVGRSALFLFLFSICNTYNVVARIYQWGMDHDRLYVSLRVVFMQG